MKVLLVLFFILFATTCFSTPIEGGRETRDSDPNFGYIDVISFKPGIQGETCTGVRISYNTIITAAHCVVGANGNLKLTKGTPIGGSTQGKITDIHVHKNYLNNNKSDTNYDVAIIKLDTDKGKRTLPYPALINTDTEFKNERGEFTMVGFGGDKFTWNDKAIWNGKYEGAYITTGTNRQRVSKSSWDNCSTCKTTSKDQLENLSQEIENIEKMLIAKVTLTNTINSGNETIDRHGTSSLAQGDSGGPAMEIDIDGNLVVTGIASSVYITATNFRFEIVGPEDKKILVPVKLSDIGKDEEEQFKWASSRIKDEDFPIIQNKLKEMNLLENGKLKEGYSVKRIYDRETENKYVNLLNPEIQSFLNEFALTR